MATGVATANLSLTGKQHAKLPSTIPDHQPVFVVLTDGSIQIYDDGPLLVKDILSEHVNHRLADSPGPRSLGLPRDQALEMGRTYYLSPGLRLALSLPAMQASSLHWLEDAPAWTHLPHALSTPGPRPAREQPSPHASSQSSACCCEPASCSAVAPPRRPWPARQCPSHAVTCSCCQDSSLPFPFPEGCDSAATTPYPAGCDWPGDGFPAKRATGKERTPAIQEEPLCLYDFMRDFEAQNWGEENGGSAGEVSPQGLLRSSTMKARTLLWRQGSLGLSLKDRLAGAVTKIFKGGQKTQSRGGLHNGLGQRLVAASCPTLDASQEHR